MKNNLDLGSKLIFGFLIFMLFAGIIFGKNNFYNNQVNANTNKKSNFKFINSSSNYDDNSNTTIYISTYYDTKYHNIVYIYYDSYLDKTNMSVVHDYSTK